MDLMTLDANNQAQKLIENYDSLIWTERFNTVGDFQITTGNVSQFMTLLPEGTRLTLRESNIAMKVETHLIERKKNVPEKLTITGRSFESILFQRVSALLTTPPTEWTVNLRTPSDLAWYIINQICVEGLVDDADIFPSDSVVFPAPVDFNTSTGPVVAMPVTRGNLLSTVLALLQTEAPADLETPAIVQHGIRAIRPGPGATAIGVEIYTGTDRSNAVYFDATRDLLDDGQYLFSKIGNGNAAYIVGSTTSAKMFEGLEIPTGFDRSVIYVDAGTSETDDIDSLKSKGSIELAAAHETAIFNGSINNDLSPYIYGVDYHLGDIVRVVGDYGLDSKCRLTEYIRSEDATGIKAYPTLSAIPT